MKSSVYPRAVLMVSRQGVGESGRQSNSTQQSFGACVLLLFPEKSGFLESRRGPRSPMCLILLGSRKAESICICPTKASLPSVDLIPKSQIPVLDTTLLLRTNPICLTQIPPLPCICARSPPVLSVSALKAFCASVTYPLNLEAHQYSCPTPVRETHLHGLIFFSKSSSSSAGVRFEVSGITKKDAKVSGADTPAKKKQVLRPQLA